MARTKRKDERHYRASVNDGLGVGYVWIVDGYDRRVDEDIRHDFRAVGVHTDAEAIAQAKAEGFGKEQS